MKYRNSLFVSLMMTALAFQILHAAEVVVLYDGDNNNYTTVDQPFTNVGGGFDTWNTPLTMAAYSGPTIYGGSEWAGTFPSPSFMVDNNNANVNNADAIRWSSGTATANSVIYGAFLFDSTVDFQLDSSSTIRLNARRTGGKDSGGTTAGVRWVLRDATSSNYYISALNSSTGTGGASFQNDYVANWGSSTLNENAPETLSWFNYNPAGDGVGTIGTSASINFATATFDQGGFFYANTRDTDGNLIMEFAQFEVTAIPEPGTFALMGLAGLAALIVARRRR